MRDLVKSLVDNAVLATKRPTFGSDRSHEETKAAETVDEAARPCPTPSAVHGAGRQDEDRPGSLAVATRGTALGVGRATLVGVMPGAVAHVLVGLSMTRCGVSDRRRERWGSGTLASGQSLTVCLAVRRAPFHARLATACVPERT